MRTITAAVLLLLAGCGGPEPEVQSVASEAAVTAPANPAVASDTPVVTTAVDPNPNGEFESVCDALLFVDDSLDEHEFAASVELKNTGNIGIVVDVVAKFDQLGRDRYKIRKPGIEIAAGGKKQVYLSERVGDDVLDRYQSGGYECNVDVRIVDTFGVVQEAVAR